MHSCSSDPDVAWSPGAGQSPQPHGASLSPCLGCALGLLDTFELTMNGFSELLLFTSLHASLWALVKSSGEEKPSEKQPCLVSGLEDDGERLDLH